MLIGKLAGIEFEKGKLKTAQLGWSWGPVPNGVFQKIKNAINNAKEIVQKGGDAAKQAWSYLKKHPDVIFLPGVSPPKQLLKLLGGLIGKLNPFD